MISVNYKEKVWFTAKCKPGEDRGGEERTKEEGTGEEAVFVAADPSVHTWK